MGVVDQIYKDLIEGMQNQALAVQELAFSVKNLKNQVEDLEQVITKTTSGTPLTTKVSLLDQRMNSVEQWRTDKISKETSLLNAQVGAKSTIIAAWIGAIVAIASVISAVFIAVLS